MINGKPVNARDLPIVKLVPRSQRKVPKRYLKRIEASIETVGLIEPLVVYSLGDQYEILDGCLRYYILLDMGVETVPCLIREEREAFTGNRMVSRLSAAQEMKMLRKSLDELDEKTIAHALGLTDIRHRLNRKLIRKLHPTIVKAFESEKIAKSTARELVHVKPERQVEILKMMGSCNDHSAVFAKSMVLKTPMSKRTMTNGVKTPWTQVDEKKSNLLKRLKEAEQEQDFYSNLYRQYTTNLLKLVIYVRGLISHERVDMYLRENYPETLDIFNEIINNTER